MKTLHLLRHAKSSRKAPVLVDFERPLSHRGQRDAATLARCTHAMSLRPQLVLCSPALRTRQTYDTIASALPAHMAPAFEAELYMASASSLFDRIRSVPKTVTELLVIGHNPGLQDLALLLIRQAPTSLRLALAKKFPTCALLTLELELETWRKLRLDCATLRRFWPLTPARASTCPAKTRIAVHAPDLTVGRDANWSDLAEAALSNVRTHVYANLGGAAAGDVQSIHQLRVALRRLRVLLRAFADVFDPEAAHALNARARSCFRSLGEVRELDVIEATVLSPLIQAHPRERALVAQRKRLLAARRKKLTKLQRMLHGSQTRSLTHGLDTMSTRHGVRLPRRPRRRARKQLQQQLGRVAELVPHALEANATQLHSLRKRSKQLRYRLEFFAPLLGHRHLSACTSTLSPLQDVLGDLNDIAVARWVLRPGETEGAQGARARKMIGAALAVREADARSKLARQLRKFARAVKEQKP